MPIEAVIFDLDGTLLDTLEDLADASNLVLREFGHPEHPVELYNYFVGDGMLSLIDRITPENIKGDSLAPYCTRFEQVYKNNWDQKTKPYAGITAMLSRLVDKNIKCAVLSNKPHEFTLACVKRFFPANTFQFVVGQRDGIPKKPDPAGALELIEKLNVTSDQCLYVGDTSVDMKTGKSAEMVTIGVLWGFRKEDELVKSGADIVVANPGEIVEYVLSTE